jgi:hypothetical protein
LYLFVYLLACLYVCIQLIVFTECFVFMSFLFVSYILSHRYVFFECINYAETNSEVR